MSAYWSAASGAPTQASCAAPGVSGDDAAAAPSAAPTADPDAAGMQSVSNAMSADDARRPLSLLSEMNGASEKPSSRDEDLYWDSVCLFEYLMYSLQIY